MKWTNSQKYKGIQDKFLKIIKYKPRLNSEEKENLKRLITSRRLNQKKNNLTKRSPGPDSFTSEFYPTFVVRHSVAKLCLIRCDPMDYSTPGLAVLHHLPEFTQTHVHRVGDAIQPSHPLSSPSPPAFNLSQHQGLFLRVSSQHQVAKILEFQLQYQSFQ